MKECKCGKIPPCYGSLERAIYEEAKKANDEWKKSRARHGKLIDKLHAKLMEGGFLDDTHDKVYELNKQMCDLDIPLRNPIKPLSEETAQELIGKWEEIGKEWASKKKEIFESIFGNITNEKSNIMEKKTKKMTKAEAFEYLKHKKVAVTGDTIALQNKLFNIGYKWCDGSIEAISMVDFLLIDDETFQFTESLSHFRKCGYTEISVDDILSIEIVEEKYELEFNYDKVVELASPLMAYLNDVGCRDSIRVSQFGIVHEPMSTLIFDNGIGE